MTMVKTRACPNGDIFARLQWGSDNLTPQQRKMCAFINENYKDAAFMTIEQISAQIGIGSATVLRTIRSLGYASFKDFAAALRGVIISQESTYWKEMRQSWKEGECGAFRNSLVEITEQNILTLENSISISLIKAFDHAVELAKKAKKILILGLRSSRTASYYLYFMLHEFIDNVILADVLDSEDIYNNIVMLGKKDVFIVFSLGGPNYVLRTHEAIKAAYSRNIPIILISDSPANPAARYASVMLSISTPDSHYSMIPVMNILDAFVANMGVIRNEERFIAQEKINKEYKIVS